MSYKTMFQDLFRDSPTGAFINYVSRGRYLKPKVLSENYVIPKKYASSFSVSSIDSKSPTEAAPGEDSNQNSQAPTLAEKSGPLATTDDGIILVDWDSDDDPDNPKNWCLAKKIIVIFIVTVITTSGYMASAIFTPAEGQMREFFGTTEVKLMLGLTLFVWGYGLTPIFVSTMSESPMFGGRRWILVFSQFWYTILQIPTALINHVAPFAVLRLLAGFAVGPPLSVSAGVISDLIDFPDAAYAIAGWSCGVVIGPFVGPLIGAALSHSNTWRWVFWFLLIQGGVAFALLIFLFPETSAQAILMKKAARLRKLTGNNNIKAQGDINLVKMSLAGELYNSVWLPIKICLREPILDLVNLHLSLLYAVIYLFFEGFPIVFVGIHRFTLVELGVTYTALAVPIGLAVIIYIYYLDRNLIKPIKAGTPKLPEVSFGYPAVLGSILVPIGLFIFGWSATPSAHWIGPIIGACIFAAGTFLLFQTYMAYIGTLYPTMFASAIASNTVLRSMIGGAFPLFGTVFFNHTATKRWPVGWGSSILGFAGLAMICLPVYFVIRGPQLRERAHARWGVADGGH